jgi:hypothetical protein
MTSKQILLVNLTHNHGSASAFLAVSMAFSTAFAYSDTSTTTATASPVSKEIPAQVKNFILNQIVNKSKAAVVVGLKIES